MIVCSLRYSASKVHAQHYIVICGLFDSSSSSVAVQPGVGLGLLYNTPPSLSIPCSVSSFVYSHLSQVRGHVIQWPVRLYTTLFHFNLIKARFSGKKKLFNRKYVLISPTFETFPILRKIL